MRRSTVSFVLLPAIMRRNISIFLIISILCASLSPSALAVDSECKDMIFITKAPGNEYFIVAPRFTGQQQFVSQHIIQPQTVAGYNDDLARMGNLCSDNLTL